MSESTEGRAPSSLFQGKQFWLSQNIPQRSRFKELITKYGGIVRLLEKDADVKLVDHTKKNLPPDTYSYKYIEESIRNGRLANLESHRVGPSAHRPVGATYIPSRGKKILYSLEDDRILWDWVQRYEGIPGYPISGNKIYQDLATAHPRHTYQSYRDRYLKKLRGNPRPGGMAGYSVQRDPEASSSIPWSTTQAVTSGTRYQSQDRSDDRPSVAHDNDDATLKLTPSTAEGRSRPEAQPQPVEQSQPAERSPSEEYSEPRREVTFNIQDPHRLRRLSDSPPVVYRQHTPSDEEAGVEEANINRQESRKRKRLPDSSPTAHRHTPQAIEAADQKRRRYPEQFTAQQTQPSPDSTRQPATTRNEKDQVETNDPEVDGLLRQLPFWPSSPEPESEGEGEEDRGGQGQQAEEGQRREESDPVQDIDEWIDDCVGTGKAQNDKQVIEALRCTTMDPDLAQQVLQHLVAGKGIPDDIPGVWTAEDDRHLEGGNARHIERVLEKHGDEFVGIRGEYLGLARATGFADTDD